jgi:uncharacterized membrane-anchored protein
MDFSQSKSLKIFRHIINIMIYWICFLQVKRFIEKEVDPILQKYANQLKGGVKVELNV